MAEEQREPTTSELLNIIKLLESTLKFYADEGNYIQKQYDSQIDLDHGTQARFALNQLKAISNYEAFLIEEFKHLSEQIQQEEEKMGISGGKEITPDQINEMLQQLKTINDQLNK